MFKADTCRWSTICYNAFYHRLDVIVPLLLFQFADENDLRDGLMCASLIWSFDVIPAPAAIQIPPAPVVPTGQMDIWLPPVDLEETANCTCFNGSKKCLHSFFDEKEFSEHVKRMPVTNMSSHDDDDEDDDNEEDDGNESVENAEEEEMDKVVESTIDGDVPPENEELCCQYFPIKGAAWDEKYQDALKLCSRKLLLKEEVKVRVTPEPENIRDKNALKFETLHEDQWLTMGYCGLPKIPKLCKAILRKEIRSLSITNLRRYWVYKVKDFRFSGGVNILKRGAWGKDDPNNTYNSSLM